MSPSLQGSEALGCRVSGVGGRQESRAGGLGGAWKIFRGRVWFRRLDPRSLFLNLRRKGSVVFL